MRTLYVLLTNPYTRRSRTSRYSRKTDTPQDLSTGAYISSSTRSSKLALHSPWSPRRCYSNECQECIDSLLSRTSSLLSIVVFFVPIQRSYPKIDEGILGKRLEEHMHRLVLTGKRLTGMQVFTPMQHMRSDSCSRDAISREVFTVIGLEKTLIS